MVADPVADALIPVASAADVRHALGAAAAALPESDDEIVAAARWGKALADDLRDMTDAWRFNGADGGWDEPEPLVTVRIPTWKGVDGLVGRAIPSVLGGSYRNVELLVCSDGPDPAARAAVEAITDPRVRYLELPERPVHPSHPWSFWETTGLRPATRRSTRPAGRSSARSTTTTPSPGTTSPSCSRPRAGRVPTSSTARRCARTRPARRTSSARHRCSTATSPTAPCCTRAGWHTCATTPPAGCSASPATSTCGGAWPGSARARASPARRPGALRERTSIEDDPRSACIGRRDAADLAPDILGTDARWLLDVRPLAACAPTS